MKKIRPLFRAGRETVFRAAFVLGLCLLLAFHFLFTDFSVKKGIRVDLTPEGLYTLSDEMKEECAFLNDETKVNGEIRAVFCSDPDQLIASDMGRAVYFMALEMQERFPKFKVETVNITENPTAVAAYRTTSLSTLRPTNVILDYNGNYRVSSLASFWMQDSDEVLYSFDGEYQLASLLLSLTLVDKPTAYFVTGHGETVYHEGPDALSAESHKLDNEKTSALVALLKERSLNVKTLDLSSVDRIPEDAVLLIINDPRSDFDADEEKFSSFNYVSDTEKIDRFLVLRQGALMVAKDYAVSLPTLEEFLAEWGIGFGTEQLREEDVYQNEKAIKGAYLTRDDGEQTDLVGQYSTDTATTPYAIYSAYSTMSSAPRTVVTNTGSVYCAFIGDTVTVNEPGAANTSKTYESFLKTTPNAVTQEEGDGKGAPFDLCALVNRTGKNNVTNEDTHAYVFASASGDFLSTEVLGNSSYANYDILSMTVKTIAFGDAYASSAVGGGSLNSQGKFGGKKLVSETLSAVETEDFPAFSAGMKTFLTVFALAVPAAAAVAGIWVFIRRRNS